MSSPARLRVRWNAWSTACGRWARETTRFPSTSSKDGEVGEVTKAFAGMRESLQHAQQRLLHSERLATIGTMASSISHDLRHPLTAVLANAEFLAEPDLLATAARRALPRDSRRGASPDRPHRFAAGVVASGGVAEPDGDRRRAFGKPGDRIDSRASRVPQGHARHHLQRSALRDVRSHARWSGSSTTCC